MVEVIKLVGRKCRDRELKVIRNETCSLVELVAVGCCSAQPDPLSLRRRPPWCAGVIV